MKWHIPLITLLSFYSSHIVGADRCLNWKEYNTRKTDFTLRILEWKIKYRKPDNIIITIDETSPATTLELHSTDGKNTAEYDGITLFLNLHGNDDVVLEAFSNDQSLTENSLYGKTENGVRVFSLTIGEKIVSEIRP